MNNYQSIPFKDEDGKEKEFYVLEQTTLNGFHYLLVEDGSADADDEEVEVLIMKRVADAAEDGQPMRWLKTRKNLYQYPKYLSS